MEIRLLANGMVGNGFSYKGFQAGLARQPHMIGCDAGTSDYGPGPLGVGRSIKSAASVRRDAEIMLQGARRLRIPLIFGSCGVAGAAPHLEETRQIVEDIARKEGLRFRLAVIHCDQDKAGLKAALRANKVRSLGPVPPLTEEAIDRSKYIVGMAGAQPFIDALDQGADVILAGRATDPAIFASVALRAGIPAGVAWAAARSIDKGNLATTDVAGGSPVLATLDPTGFVIEPMKEDTACTVKSVSALFMYENPDPWSIVQPSGSISTQFANFEQLDDRRVRVSGALFTPAAAHTVKLEGATQVGFRAAALLGIRDPRIIGGLDDFLRRLEEVVLKIAKSLSIARSDFQLKFRCYGRDAVMGGTEPKRNDPIHEIGLVIDVIARTQEQATTLVNRAISSGSKLEPAIGIPAGGNFASPFSPSTLSLGESFEWSVWHLLEVENERDAFRVEIAEI